MLAGATTTTTLGSTLLLSLPFFSVSVFAHAGAHESARGLPGPGYWYQRDNHPVHDLFKRDSAGATDGVSYPAVGSDGWSNGWPTQWSNDSPTPRAEWVTALNAAVARKAIPTYAPSTVNEAGGIPTYASGLNPNDASVCSGTYGCAIPGDVWNAPDGHIGISFDDGPLPPTDPLLDFLDAQSGKPTVTHFFIGSNILEQPSQFTRAFTRGDDLAVHTWTHPMMTTKSNEDVVGEIGWTMELIHNSTGGRVPRFWRPPYGDTDTRVSAIAKEVFGLTTIVWNQDTADWSLTDSPPGTSLSAINSSYSGWLKGSKSPGLIVLEHELSNDSVDAFKAAWPEIVAEGWQISSLATLIGNGTVYLNAVDDTAAVNPVQDVVLAASVGLPKSSSAAPTQSGANLQAGGTGAGTAAAAGPSASAKPTAAGTSAAQSSFGAPSVTLFLAAFAAVLVAVL
ncbi:Carbohydrate esterase family 4 protein [Mycena chlorophos]|uniref:chitin deacetylase n=1 Tax=Mycena chlorophos TaxID=658473 RepID=A0A8H6W1I8_MYCCL|nr:Carbohydrate esterase family 4 protein [Mycena chlorophos]